MTNDQPGTRTQATSDAATRQLVVTREFNAPRELVFRAYSEADHLKQWWGPKDWTVPFCEIDFRPGGVWFYCMESPDGQQSWGKAFFREVVRPERIVHVDTFVDASGDLLPGLPQLLITTEFFERDGRTTVVATTQFNTAEELQQVIEMGAVEGITQTHERLDQWLATVSTVSTDR